MNAIVLCDAKNGIAKNGDQPIHIPNDMKRLRALIKDHTVVMGRKTAEVIGKPLKECTNIIITSNPESIGPRFADCQRMTLRKLLDDWYQYNQEPNSCWLLGGGILYRALSSHCDRIYLTRVDEDFDCDQYFPRISWLHWSLEMEGHPMIYVDADGVEHVYHFDIYRRRGVPSFR